MSTGEDKLITIDDLTGIIKTKELAKLLGVTERQIQIRTQAGRIHKADAETGKKGVYRMLDVVREYREMLAEAARGNKPHDEQESNLEKDKLKAEIKYKEAKAKKAAVELKEYEGLFHRSEDVEKIVTELIFTVRAALMAMPGRLSTECAEKSSVEISDILKREVYGILQQLSEHEYDPEKYREIVRKREGYRTLQGDEKDDEE